MLNIPIVIFVFNRPQSTERLIERLRSVKPTILFIVADEARSIHSKEIDQCQKVRAIIETIDWPCEVVKNYADRHLGCGYCISRGINWVFTQVEEAIFLEDDCLPVPSFFQFCSELLERYREEHRVTQICGTNPLGKWKSNEQSYHFSLYGSAWGWATWKRAWKYYDHGISAYSQSNVLQSIAQLIKHPEEFEHFQKGCVFALRNLSHCWDYQWSFAQLSQGGLSVVPSQNLVQNVGISLDATNTKNPILKDFLDVYDLDFPLITPSEVILDREYSHQHYLFFSGKPSFDHSISIIKSFLKKGRIVQALVITQKLLNEHPNNSDLLSYRRVILARLGRQESSEYINSISQECTKSLNNESNN
ncbi:hypothetical protein [Synechococcus sp. PCC 6312]|uniref:hypothetical protein n=1 Tax=Synechococcus sp. (strain ATCC 27167 / PCC 6312) TaxID=195253 RepID=UPI00029F3AB4|nr:hypothetical protein [Synechococcus sp. PCC 6312]AFY61431.1 hypothetical protein Syn6312_2316 [Synechococcus sp. PCC 6312]